MGGGGRMDESNILSEEGLVRLEEVALNQETVATDVKPFLSGYPQHRLYSSPARLCEVKVRQ